MSTRQNGRRSNRISDPLFAEIVALSREPVTRRRERRAPTVPPIRVLIVDGQPLVRLGLASLLGVARSCHVVGEAGTAIEAVDAVHQHKPEVILMDADLSGGCGLATARRLRSEDLCPRVILLATASDPSLVVAAIQAGAAGYVLTNAGPAHLVESVEVVAAGGTYFDPAALASALDWLRAGSPGTEPLARLSEREINILPLIAEGRTNNDIAIELGLSQYTVKTYVSAILRKVGVVSRAEAAAYAVRAGAQTAGLQLASRESRADEP